jgi:hypothetical protein
MQLGIPFTWREVFVKDLRGKMEEKKIIRLTETVQSAG